MMLRRGSTRPAAAVAVATLAAAAFVLLAVLTAAAWPPLEQFDTAVSDVLRRFGASQPRLIAVVRIATEVAATMTYLATGLLVTVVLQVRGHRRTAARVLAVTAVVPVLWGLLHWLLPHRRPVDGFVTITSNGFPSGHTSHAAAAALTAILLLRPVLCRRGRVILLVTAVSFAVTVGGSRLVLLAHWPSDVLGGWLLVGAVVPLLVPARGQSASGRPAPRRRCRTATTVAADPTHRTAEAADRG